MGRSVLRPYEGKMACKTAATKTSRQDGPRGKPALRNGWGPSATLRMNKPRPYKSRTKLELVVVDFDPVAVGILQVKLLDAVGAGSHFAVAGEIAIFHVHLIEMSHKAGD